MSDSHDTALPLAYFITFRCYGTWLHGDPRGSVDRHHNAYGAPTIPATPALEHSERQQLRHPPIALDALQRQVVEAAVRGVCDHRHYVLRALNARTNHVHCVVALPLTVAPTVAPTVARPSGSASISTSPSPHTVARPSGSASSPPGALFHPEPLLAAFKAYATRALRQAGLIDMHTKPWSRHGSTIYLWTDTDVAEAIAYVLSAQ
jgi:hypothetical protein